MNDKDKLIHYEVHIEDMINVFQERFDKLDANYQNLSEYEQGRWMAYWEVMDIIKTRYSMILELIAESDE